MIEFMGDLGRRIMGKYLGRGPLALYNNMNRVFESKSGEVLIQKTNGNKVRGRLVNFEHEEGFTLWPSGEEGRKVPSIVIRSKEVSRSYLV